MAQSAPAASALARSPEYLMPPSAITGVPVACAASTASMIAVSCGTPTPATMRVVQIEPGPMPTLMASAPQSISALAPSAVATLPATTCTAFDSRLMRGDGVEHVLRMAMRGVDHDEIDAGVDQRSVRAKPLSPTVVAAATRRRPCSSLQAFGLATAFSMSLTVIRPTQRYWSSTTSSFSMRCWCSSRLASSWLDALAHGDEIVLGHQFGDALARIGGEAHVAVGQNADQLARLAVALRALDHRNAGDAVVLHQLERLLQRRRRLDGQRVHHHAGFELLDLAHLRRLLFRLHVAVEDADAAGLRHGDRHRPLSVTVSMAEATIGILSGIERVMRERTSTSDGSTSDRPGLISTSSKVSASRRFPLFLAAIANSVTPEKGTKAACRRMMKMPGGEEMSSPDVIGPLLGWRGSLAWECRDS